jgi:hypothetical protein
MFMKYAPVVPKEIVSIMQRTSSVHPIGLRSFQTEIMGRKCKTGLMQNNLFYEKTRKESGQLICVAIPPG